MRPGRRRRTEGHIDAFSVARMKPRLCHRPAPFMVRVRAVFGALRAGHVAQTISRPPGGVRKGGRSGDSIKVMTLPGPSRTIIVEPIKRPEHAPVHPEPEPDPAPSEPEPSRNPHPEPDAREGAGAQRMTR